MNQTSYKRHRFPAEIIQHAVWLYCRFTLSFRDVEDLLAERGLDISYESIRCWVAKFGAAYARRIRRRRSRPGSRWHLDEVFVSIRGKKMYLWRAVDSEGEVLDILVQARRNKKAALKLMRRLLKKQGGLTSGSGLIYSVTPVLTLTAQDQSIDKGDSPDDTALTVSLSVGGTAVDADAFGIDTSTAQVHLAGSVPTAAAGTPRAGTWAGGLEVDPTYSTWSGVTLTRDSGDLTVTGTPEPDDDVGPNPPSEDRPWQTFNPPRQASCSMSDGTASCLDTTKLEQ